MVKQVPSDTQKLISIIPGLEEVDEILQKIDIQHRFEKDSGNGVRLLASILRVALDFDFYEEQGHDRSVIIQTLKSRKDDYDPAVSDSLSNLLVVAEQTFKLEEISLKSLEVGMRLAQELRLEDGFLVASSGADVDRQLIKVIRNYNSCYAESPFPKKYKSQFRLILNYDIRLKVRSYIWILSTASLGGAFLVGILGWWMFQSTNYLTAQYYEASENSGNSAGEYSDVNDFLEVVREILFPWKYIQLIMKVCLA